MTTPEREAAATEAIDQRGKETRPTQEQREAWAWGQLKKISCGYRPLWHRLDNTGRAGTLRAILGVIDRERVEATERLCNAAGDAVDGYRDQPEELNTWAADDEELIAAVDELRELTEAEDART